jgi:hypothetical protein
VSAERRHVRQAVDETARASDVHGAGSPAVRLLNLRQAAVYLGLSFWTIRDYVLAGELPTVSLPPLRSREGERPRQTLRRVLIDVEDLDAFIVAHKSQHERESQSRARQIEATTTGVKRGAVPGVCPNEAAQKARGRL